VRIPVIGVKWLAVSHWWINDALNSRDGAINFDTKNEAIDWLARL
jgi:hypothetical protein